MTRTSAFLALFFGFAACGGGDHSTDGSPAVMDAGTPDLIGAMCKDPRADVYQPNLMKSSSMGLYTLTLNASDPAPPILGNNSWTVTVGDPSGTPISTAALAVPTKFGGHPNPWMPDHGHGTTLVQVTPATGTGGYTITPLYYYMPGLWTITFTLQANGSDVVDSVAFSFCLADS